MIAAIYCRKSTEQHGVSDDQKSIARQIEHARDYAQRKGWHVANEHVYTDDGISGAEFANRPGFLRLVFFYLEDRERTLDSPTDKMMLSLTAFADELEREKARQRTYDAMVRKARAGHVTGGRVFGYDNVDVIGADGRRSHVERRINDTEAAIVRRIFALSAQGKGLTCITKTLNDEAAPSPRAQQGRPRAWAPSSVREVLHRTLYRGEITWNRTRKRNQQGQVQQKARNASELITIAAPECASCPKTCGSRCMTGSNSSAVRICGTTTDA